MRVLLVEDDPATAQIAEMMLKSESYVCDVTDMGEDALEIGKLYDYDIIILDLMLPDMDGYGPGPRPCATQGAIMSNRRPPAYLLYGTGGWQAKQIALQRSSPRVSQIRSVLRRPRDLVRATIACLLSRIRRRGRRTNS